MSDRVTPSVLVVEDEPQLQQLLVESLERDGFAVAQAFDGADALDRLRGFAYDALVVDLRLPDANGLDILDEALTRFPELRAVVMTGFGGVSEAASESLRRAVISGDGETAAAAVVAIFDPVGQAEGVVGRVPA